MQSVVTIPAPVDRARHPQVDQMTDSQVPVVGIGQEVAAIHQVAEGNRIQVVGTHQVAMEAILEVADRLVDTRTIGIHLVTVFPTMMTGFRIGGHTQTIGIP